MSKLSQLAVALDDAASTEIVTDSVGLRRLGAAWSRIAQDRAATPFQTYAWNLAWWELVGAREAHLRLHVIAIRLRGRILAIAPLMLDERPPGGAVMRYLGFPWIDYGDVLAEAGEPGRLAIEQIGSYLSAGLGRQWRSVELDETRPESELSRLLGPTWSRAEGTLCPLRELNAERVVAARRSLRSLCRRAERVGDVQFSLHTYPADIADRMPDFMTMHVRQWYRREDCGITFAYPDVLRFYAESVRYLAPVGLLGLAELTIGGRPAAFYYGFLYRGTFWAYRPAFEIELHRVSPGTMLNRLLFAELYAAGYDTFDMMRGDFAYKQRHATENHHTVALHLVDAERGGPCPEPATV